jgi:hypothetical protein
MGVSGMTKSKMGGNMEQTARDQREFPRKEWHSPSLRKLSIAATATTRVHISHDDGNTKKVGTAGTNS